MRNNSKALKENTKRGQETAPALSREHQRAACCGAQERGAGV